MPIDRPGICCLAIVAPSLSGSYREFLHIRIGILLRAACHAHVRFGSILLKKASLISTNHDSVFLKLSATGEGHDGSPDGRSEPAVLPFNLEEQIPADHLLRRLSPIVTRALVDLRRSRHCRMTESDPKLT